MCEREISLIIDRDLHAPKFTSVERTVKAMIKITDKKSQTQCKVLALFVLVKVFYTKAITMVKIKIPFDIFLLAILKIKTA
jgi:hypothetical protein